MQFQESLQQNNIKKEFMETSSKRPHISIIIPCCNEEDAFPFLRRALTDLAAKIENEMDMSFLFVDDGSRDRTWEAILAFANDDPRVQGISLSRNFGHQAALTCGYDFAQGDAVICLDADLQDPPEVILQLINKWREGNDIVYAVRESRAGETKFKLLTAAFFYKIMHSLGAYYIKRDSGDFRLLNRKSLDALNRLREQHRYIRGMVGWLGFKSAEVRYQRKSRVAGSTKYPFLKMLKLAIDAIVSFSFAPLRAAYLMGFGLMLVTYCYLIYTFVLLVFYGVHLIPGWTSLLLTTVAFGTACLVSIGFLGEYVGRIYDQAKGRPLYLVKDLVAKTHSSAEDARQCDE